MRGRFSAGATDDEWCERRLLARIHHYTIKRLRAEIEPVAARDFIRFLFSWQHVAPEARMEGAKALGPVIDQLEGFGAPAGAWESEILPARIADYAPSWLDARCLAGQSAWTRLRSRGARAADGDRRSGRCARRRSRWYRVATSRCGAACCRPTKPSRAPRRVP